MTDLDLPSLLESWHLALRSQKKSPHTIESYLFGVKAYLKWCERGGHPMILSKDGLQTFTAEALDAGAADCTAYSRHTSCKLFSKWLLAEGELAEDPLAGMSPPAVGEKLVDPLSEAEIKAMIKACEGKSFTDRRDEAIIRFMVETLTRAREVSGMLRSETKVIDGTAVVHGKGSKDRIVPFGPFTAQAMDRYLRIRKQHRLAESPQLWLGGKGRTFGYMGLYYSLNLRADKAGIADFHPHRLRHTGAHRWLDAGGTEGGLMTVGGWDSPLMLRRYTKRLAAERAVSESRRLNLGDF